ncbi:hypothetical protein ScPMuIL_008187 [Solemya velum]
MKKPGRQSRKMKKALYRQASMTLFPSPGGGTSWKKLGNIRLGMMRHLFIVIDMSEAMNDQDLRPSRLVATLKLLEYFIEEYFDHNPISQLGVITTRNKRAEKLTELGGNPRRHISSVQSLKTTTCQGEPSLQNSLELAAQTLSLTTCDPGDINDTIKILNDSNTRCSVIGLSAEVRICKKLCQSTGGKYAVILDEHHYKDLLGTQVSPPPATANSESSLIRMGFPHHQLSGQKDGEMPSMCMCHIDSQSVHGFSTIGYFCPQCKSKYCELPIECKACGLTLVSAPHLARSYHHLFPLNTFKEVPVMELDADQTIHCNACQVEIKEQNIYTCQKCQQVFCLDCDLFIHETLHSCPGCSSSRSTQQTEMISELP